MVATGPVSAVVVRVRLPRALERQRRRWDPVARAGVPAHVTILFPFRPVARLGPADRRTLARIAAAQEPFDVRFARIGRFPSVLYLAPDPAAAFVSLTDAVVASYPDFPPYEGAFDDVIPHLTLAEAEGAPIDEIEAQTAAALPFELRVRALEVIVEGSDGRWRSRWRIGLGIRR